MIPPIVAEIHAHSDAVLKKEDACGHFRCPNCGGTPDAFQRHAVRCRTFWVVWDGLVHRVRSYLTRWKCRLCSSTFTGYPGFVMPFKRYVLPDMLAAAGRYLDEDAASYRDAVRLEGRPVAYASGDTTIDDRTLQPSTLWRWIAALGALTRTLHRALGLLQEKTGRSYSRRVLPVAPRQSRSEARRRHLETTQRLVVAENDYRLRFARSLFPELATACAWS